jgi:hypothetical protein
MSPDERLEAILTRLGDIEKNSAAHHARVEVEMARIGDRLEVLSDRIKVQNGRVTKLEGQVGELQMQARIAQHHDEDDEDRRDTLSNRIWSFVQGAALIGLGALLGHIF